jgi:predicted site-specific integrase-resolvase
MRVFPRSIRKMIWNGNWSGSADYAAAQGYQVTRMVSEIGSGLNDRRPKFLKLLTDPTIGVIVVEYRDRGTRFGFTYIEQLLAMQGRRKARDLSK